MGLHATRAKVLPLVVDQLCPGTRVLVYTMAIRHQYDTIQGGKQHSDTSDARDTHLRGRLQHGIRLEMENGVISDRSNE